MKTCKSRLSPVSLGFAFGILGGLWMVLFAWYAYFSGNASAMALISQWGGIFSGFDATIVGGLIGGLWGFIKGFICGLIFGWIYNGCLCCCKAICRSSDSYDETK